MSEQYHEMYEELGMDVELHEEVLAAIAQSFEECVLSQQGRPEGMAYFDGLVEAVDVVPTLLECAGLPVPRHLQGRSFRPMLENRTAEGRRSALAEMTGWKTLRIEGFRYVVEASGRESLYDLARDPVGYHDVASEPAYAAVLAEVRHELLRRLIERERPIPRTWPY